MIARGCERCNHHCTIKSGNFRKPMRRSRSAGLQPHPPQWHPPLNQQTLRSHRAMRGGIRSEKKQKQRHRTCVGGLAGQRFLPHSGEQHSSTSEEKLGLERSVEISKYAAIS